MKRLLFILLTFHFSLFTSFAQEMKPCGTSVLARRHTTGTHAFSRERFRKMSQQKTFLGEKRGLIILVEFPDAKFQNVNPHQTWSDIANLNGYSEHKAPGSVSDYFYDQSYGQFRLLFDVVGPVEAQHEYAYYGQNFDWGPPTGWFDKNVGALVEEACVAVSDQVRFTDYDWDADGKVEQVFLLYAGHGENDYWSKDSTVIWPHMASLIEDWGYKNGLLLQGVCIDTYACTNEVNSINNLDGLGTFCHEFSHCLGLPDLYDTEKGNSVLGRYDLMDQGGYCGGGWFPVGYSSYERYACGWLPPVEVNDPLSIQGIDSDAKQISKSDVQTISPLIRYPDACLYRTTPDANDYYLIEYRLKESWDTYFPKAGLSAWHIDYDEQAWYENTVNNDPHHLRVEYMTPDEIKPSGIVGILRDDDKKVAVVYDVQGHRLPALPAAPGLYIVKYTDGTTKKCIR